MSAASISARLRRVLHAFWRSVLIAPSVRMWLRIWWRFAYAHFLLQRNPQLVRGGWITLSIRCAGGRRRIRLRDNCWDVLTFYEVFLKEVYRAAVPLPPRATVVDLGANIGLASIYIACEAHEPRIVAVEPDAENFQLLVNNLKGDHAVCYPVAIGVSRGKSRLELRDSVSHRLTNDDPSPGENFTEVCTVTLDDLGVTGKLDLLKIDIEGAEAHVLDRRWALLERTETILMEAHGPGTEVRVTASLHDQGFGRVTRPPYSDPIAFPLVFRRS